MLEETYTTLKGEELDLSELTDPERAHLERAIELYQSGQFRQLVGFHKGGDNPLARQDERGAYFEDEDLEQPSWKVGEDLIWRAQLRAAGQDPEAAVRARYTIDVMHAAERLEITPDEVEALAAAGTIRSVLRDGARYFSKRSLKAYERKRRIQQG